MLMVMQAYDVQRAGIQYGYDVGSHAINHPMAYRSRLYNIYSTVNPKPYRAYGPHSFEKVTVEGLNGFAYYCTRLPKDNYWLVWQGCPSNLGYWFNFDAMAGERDVALTDSYNKCVAKIGDMVRGNTDLSIDICQGSKTLAIGHDVAKVLRNFVEFRKNPLKLGKTVGQAWLTWVYGMKPTLQSIYDAVHFSSVHYNNEFAFTKARATSRCVNKAENFGAQWPDYTYKTDWQGEVSARCEIGIILRIPDNPLTQTARLSSLNPVSMAWELLPYSFVVDWFYNIGGYLRDLETALTYSSYFVRGYRTYTTITKYTGLGYRSIWFPTEYYTGKWGAVVQRKSFARTALSSYPMPARPVFNANLGSGRLLNAAALLTTFLARPKGRAGSDFQRAQRGVY